MLTERLYLDFEAVIPDWESAAEAIRPGRGVVFVEMMPPPERIGSLYIPDEVRFTRTDGEEPLPGFEPSVGCVIASGVPDLRPGTIVLARDGDGMTIEDFRTGKYLSKQEVRIFGRVVPENEKEGYIEDLPWDESLVAEFDMEEKRIKMPLGKNYVIRREGVSDKTESGIWLPETAQTAPCIGEVIRTGPKTTQFGLGQRVLYHVESFVEIPGSENLRIVHEDAILCVCNA